MINSVFVKLTSKKVWNHNSVACTHAPHSFSWSSCIILTLFTTRIHICSCYHFYLLYLYTQSINFIINFKQSYHRFLWCTDIFDPNFCYFSLLFLYIINKYQINSNKKSHSQQFLYHFGVLELKIIYLVSLNFRIFSLSNELSHMRRRLVWTF